MNNTELIRKVKQLDNNMKSELSNLSKIVSELNLRQFKNEDATIEKRKFNKAQSNYQKYLNGLKTNFKFLKAQRVLSVEDTIKIEKSIEEYETEYGKIVKYLNL